MSLYLLGPYTDPATTKRFLATYKKSGQKLDTGTSCIRFKSAEDLANAKAKPKRPQATVRSRRVSI